MGNICQQCTERDGLRYVLYFKPGENQRVEWWVCNFCADKLLQQGVATVPYQPPAAPRKTNNSPMIVGRSTNNNALCPCGSGVKYKRCCKKTSGLRVTLPMIGRKRFAIAKEKAQ